MSNAPEVKIASEGRALKRELQNLVIQMHSSGISYAEALRQFKRRYLLEILAQHKGNQCKAAEELGIHRNTLSRMLSELEMDSAQIRVGIRNGMRRPPASERPLAGQTGTVGSR